MTHTQWPKFKITTFNPSTGSNDVAIVGRADALTRMHGYRNPEIAIDQLAHGSVVGIGGNGEQPYFQRYSFDDSIRDAAPELLEQLKLVTGRLEYVLEQESTFKSVNINGNAVRREAVESARLVIAKAEGGGQG